MKRVNFRKLSISILILIVLCTFICFLSGCNIIYPIIYNTPEKNEAAIRKIIEEKFLKDGYCESYTMYPLYDENDNLAVYMIVMHPYKDILYVQPVLTKKNFFATAYYPCGRISIPRSSAQSPYFNGWYRYRFEDPGVDGWVYCENEQGTAEYRECDENGNVILRDYAISPYQAAGVLDEKLYFLKIPGEESQYVQAVKRDDKFFNLFSLEYFDLNSGEQIEGYHFIFRKDIRFDFEFINLE